MQSEYYNWEHAGIDADIKINAEKKINKKKRKL
jgi:hypothetical protein